MKIDIRNHTHRGILLILAGIVIMLTLDILVGLGAGILGLCLGIAGLIDLGIEMEDE